MHFLKSGLLVRGQTLLRRFGQHLLKSEADLTLDADRNVLLNEVLHHRKVIRMILGFSFDSMDFCIQSSLGLLEVHRVVLALRKLIEQVLLASQPLLMILEQAFLNFLASLKSHGSRFKVQEPMIMLQFLLAALIQASDQMRCCLVVLGDELRLPLGALGSLAFDILSELVQDVVYLGASLLRILVEEL